jgi:predicted CXXCH cytochrome family protein
LAREGPALCAECHDDLTEDLPHVHGPVAVGACTACHQPHGSDHAHLLTGEEKELCVQCHTAIRETTAAAAHVHRPVGEGCLACHAAHGAKNKRMLTSEPPELCLDCHTEIAEALSEGDPRPHGPVKNGECETCHEPHASSRAHLLARDYPPNFYAPFDEKGYGLCFECHEPEAFTEKETDEATGFRDGKRNLHYLHVNRTVKGRTCRACHDPHASKNGKHIVDRVPFGTWRIPLNFKETPTGGSCQPGCHRPQQYDRDQPRNSEK